MTEQLKYQQSSEDLLLAAESECPICARVVVELRKQKFMPISLGSTLFINVQVQFISEYSTPYLVSQAHKENDSIAEFPNEATTIKFKFHEIAQEDLGNIASASEQQFESDNMCSTKDVDLSKRIHACDKHELCLQEDHVYTPPRLLHCEEKSIKLIDAFQITEKFQGSIPYATLSH
jgi:hypothetical protein